MIMAGRFGGPPKGRAGDPSPALSQSRFVSDAYTNFVTPGRATGGVSIGPNS